MKFTTAENVEFLKHHAEVASPWQGAIEVMASVVVRDGSVVWFAEVRVFVAGRGYIPFAAGTEYGKTADAAIANLARVVREDLKRTAKRSVAA